MLCAATGRTAAELIHERSDPDRPNMGLTTWKGADRGHPLRKAEIGTARNCLGEAEIREFNLIAEAFLSAAELRAARRRPMRLSDWEQALEDLLAMSELPKLRGAGSVSTTDAERVAHERYAELDANRKEAERQVAAEAGDVEELKRIVGLTSGQPQRQISRHEFKLPAFSSSFSRTPFVRCRLEGAGAKYPTWQGLSAKKIKLFLELGE